MNRFSNWVETPRMTWIDWVLIAVFFMVMFGPIVMMLEVGK